MQWKQGESRGRSRCARLRWLLSCLWVSSAASSWPRLWSPASPEQAAGPDGATAPLFSDFPYSGGIALCVLPSGKAHRLGSSGGHTKCPDVLVPPGCGALCPLQPTPLCLNPLPPDAADAGFDARPLLTDLSLEYVLSAAHQAAGARGAVPGTVVRAWHDPSSSVTSAPRQVSY